MHDDVTGGATMSPFDAFLYRGDASPRTRSTLVALYVLDRAPTREAFVAAFDRASRLIPRLRQHVVVPPLPVLLPAWIVDPDFDLGAHLRFERLRRPGSMRELLDLVDAEVTRPLDLTRPLWDATLVEGLAEGRGAAVIRMSHAVTDGIGAVKLFAALFDARRSVRRGALQPSPPPRDVTPRELQAAALRRAPAGLLRLASAGAREGRELLARTLASPASALDAAAAYLGSLRRVLKLPAEPSPLLAARSDARRCLTLEFPLAAARRAGRAVAASVNDVYLAGLVGALRHYHVALGRPVESLPVAIPVNLRRGDEPAAGNRFGGVWFAAPLGEADVERRVAAIRERVAAGRSEPAVDAPVALAPLLVRLPATMLERLAGRVPRADVQASNVPGPPRSVYLAGGRVIGAFPFGPVPGVAAMFAMQSLAGTCFLGANLDAAAFPRIEVLAGALQRGFEEALALGDGRVRVAPPVHGHGPPRQRRR